MASLELALLLPLVAVVLVGVLQVVGIARDVLVVQDLARQAARRAATTSDNGDVVGVVTARLPGAVVRVSPSTRRPHDLVEVEVGLDVRIAGRDLQITGRGVASVEPGVS